MARVLKVAPVFAALIAIAAPSVAQLTTQHVSSDDALSSALSNQRFLGEGCMVDSRSFGVELGGDPGNPAATAQYQWPNGKAVGWTLTYDSSTDVVTLSVDGTTLSSVASLVGFTEIFVKARAQDAGAEVRVDNLVLDGQAIDDQSRASGDDLDILWISGGTLFDGFTLTGRATMTWSESTPSPPRLVFQLNVGSLGPVTVYAATWGTLKNYFYR